MDFEKEYKEMVQRARELHESGNALTKQQMEIVCPALAESEDEEIRKGLIQHLQELSECNYEGCSIPIKFPEHYKVWIDYLEKQKEPKSFNDTQEYLEGVERVQGYDELTKFEKVFDRIADTYAHRKNKDGYNKPWYVKERAAEMLYHAKEELGLCLEQKSVECSEDKIPKDIEKDATQFCFDKGINITPHQAKEIATHYLMVGHNEGYIEGRKNAHIPAKELGLPSSMDFKPEWSEEDEKYLNLVINIVASDFGEDSPTVSWLKSLRHQPKQEWSEKDKNIINGAVGALEAHGHEKLAKRLKSLRPQPYWRPSVAQMRALDEVYKTHSADNVCRRIIFNLMEDLKKLL